MQIYILDNKDHPIEEDLKPQLIALDRDYRKIALPKSQQALSSLVVDHSPALLFVPAIWEDLLIVKIIQDLELNNPEVAVIACGDPGESTNLALAFNEGLAALVFPSISEKQLARVINKVERKLLSSIKGKTEHAPPVCASAYCPEHEVRDRMFAAAFCDAIYREGPFVEKAIRVLSISPSSAQQQHLSSHLGKIDIAVDRASSIEEACALVRDNEYHAIVTSNILPDGDAPTLSKRVREALKQNVPRLIVWTSNKENVSELRDPNHKIDDVVLKPSAEAGMESILLSIVIGVYQTL